MHTYKETDTVMSAVERVQLEEKHLLNMYMWEDSLFTLTVLSHWLTPTLGPKADTDIAAVRLNLWLSERFQC